MSAQSAIEKQWDKWINSSSNDLIMLDHDASAHQVTFLSEDDEFTLRYPSDYPSSTTQFSVSSSSRRLIPILANVTATYITKTDAKKVTLASLLDKIFEELESGSGDPDASHSGSDVDMADGDEDEDDAMDEDFDASGYDDGLEIQPEEIEMLKKKKRWRDREVEIRAAHEQEKLKKKKKVGANKEKVENIFTSSAASGILTTEIVNIMDNTKELGFNAKPIDDNIYEWEVRLFDLKPGSELAKDMETLQTKYGYDYISFSMSFKIDLFPFYPPLVKLVRVIRPRFKGFMIGRITSMEMLKLDNWDPVQTTQSIIRSVRSLLEEHGQIDVENFMNDKERYPRGAYSELEYLLLELELLCDKDPRANLKYPLADWQKKERAVTVAKRQENEKKVKQYWASGTGYGHDSAASSWNVAAYLAAQKERDFEFERVLELITKGIRDTVNMPPQILSSTFLVLEESCLVPVLESYLANDSLLDMNRHTSLYQTVFGLVRAIAEHKSFGGGLLDKLEHQSRSLFELFQALHRQAAIYRKSVAGAGHMSEEDTIVQEIEQTWVTVSDAVTRYRSSRKSASGLVTSSGSSAAAAGEGAEYVNFMKGHQFDYLDILERLKNVYHYASAIKSEGVSSSKDRVLRLAQEHSNLSQSLPLSPDSSVFVRVDEERMDVMNALITGPLDTPYAGGCFIFDIFFPGSYPNVPPLVNLRTTGAGSVRFNPNLYNTGKVCLSLLGTWSGSEGENWNQHTSTFLQVLVSIQALILVPMPYFNEPGYERSMGTPEGDNQNRLYNENIQFETVRWAMLDQLKHPKPGFEEVIQAHFYLLKESIYKVINGWINDPKASSGHQTRLRNLLKDLQVEIGKLKAPEAKKEDV